MLIRQIQMIGANDVADSPLCARDICIYSYIIRGGRVTVPTNPCSVPLRSTVGVYSVFIVGYI
jgi:hypothetical protein